MKTLLMVALWSLPVVVVIGGGAVIHFDGKWRQQARVDAANAEVRQAVQGAEGWLQQARAKEGENVEQRLMKAIAANEVSEKANADAMLETVRARRAELAADALFEAAKAKLDAKSTAEAAALLQSYVADGHATKKPEARQLLADCELATSDKAALQTLVGLSDERFAQFQNTGKLDDGKLTRPMLVEIRATTLRRNLETATQRREEIKVAEANRQQEEKRLAEAKRQESERLALETRRAAEDAQAAKEQAAKDAAESLRTRTVGEWRWGRGDLIEKLQLAQDGTFVEKGPWGERARGVWSVEQDGTIRVSGNNNYSAVVRVNPNGDKISIALATSGAPMQAEASRYVDPATKPFSEADIPGVWVHTPGAAELSREITLLPDGKIDDPSGRSRWTLKGQTLVLRWADRRAPGGFWVDTCTVAWGPQGQRLHYHGVNQRKISIDGYKGNLPPWFEKRRQEIVEGNRHHAEVTREIRARRAWEDAHWAELHPSAPRGDGRVTWPDEPKHEAPTARNSYDPNKGGTPQRPNP
jgi:hypothetical protein